MTLGLLGKKCGMTRIFSDDGVSIPVTIIEIPPNCVTQIKTTENDGYDGIQVTVGNKKPTNLSRPLAGHFSKAGVSPGIKLHEFRASKKELEGVNLGKEFKAEYFSIGQYVDVSGITKGKGFAGTIKRHHFSSQDATHGNSVSHRVPGSIGQRQSPGKVFKGKKMAGHLGNVMRTVLSQKIVHIDAEKGLLFVKGAVPGAVNKFVVVKPAIKAKLN